MLNWLAVHFGDLLIGLILIAIVALIIRRKIKDQQKGGCAGCAFAKNCPSNCHCQKDMSLEELQELLKKQETNH